jgi:hypothetical protein
MKRKIIIISASILPKNSPRANRTTELAKEFGRQGHDVTVYAVLGNYDYSDFEKTYNVKVKSIGKMRFATINSDGKAKNTIVSVLLSKLFHKLIDFPDIELSFKVLNFLKKEFKADLLITIAVPYALHFGAAFSKIKLKEKFPENWIADCGDPFMGNKFIKPFFYFKHVEKWFCKHADYLTVPIEEAKVGYYKEFHDKIKVIPQGFNFDEVKINEKTNNNNKVLTLVYAGAFYKGIRDPKQFLEYLSTLDIDFKFVVFTKNKATVEPFKIALGAKLEVKEYIPRNDLLNVMSKADFLVNFENGTAVQSPSKLIDYALAKRPILSIESLKLDEDNVDAFFEGNYKDQLIVENIEQFNIKNVVNNFISLIK